MMYIHFLISSNKIQATTLLDKMNYNLIYEICEICALYLKLIKCITNLRKSLHVNRINPISFERKD